VVRGTIGEAVLVSPLPGPIALGDALVSSIACSVYKLRVVLRRERIVPRACCGGLWGTPPSRNLRGLPRDKQDERGASIWMRMTPDA
jgi:hypothetical protein